MDKKELTYDEAMAEIEAVKKSEAEAAHEKAVPDDEQWDAEAY